MKNNPKLIKHLNLLIILGVCTFAEGCQMTTTPSFNGNAKEIKLANQMFDSIGGMEAWSKIDCLYIKAIHTQPNMNSPYVSEIWRSLDEFNLIIEQRSDSFHSKAILNDSIGKIHFYDQRDTVKFMTKTQLENWRYNNHHNLYVALKIISSNPEDFTVKLDNENRVEFYKKTSFYVSFGLDLNFRPKYFYKANKDGSKRGSVFKEMDLYNSLVHPINGHPIDSSFTFKTMIWKPFMNE